MKTIGRIALAASAVVVGLNINASASSGNWLPAAGGSWIDDLNWSAAHPDGAGQTATINTDITAAATITLEANSITVGSLTVGDTSGSPPPFNVFTIAPGAAVAGPFAVNTLVFNNNGSSATLTGTGAENVISAPVQLSDSLNVTTPVLTTANLTITGNISESGGARSITKAGGSSTALDLRGSNSYSGGTVINAGTIIARNNAAFGTGSITMNAGLRILLAGGVNIPNSVTLNATPGGSARSLLENLNGGTATFSGPITVNAQPTAGGHFGTGASPGAGILRLTGPITSSVILVHRIGTVVYSGGGTGYTALNAVEGTIVVGANNGLATTARIGLGINGTGGDAFNGGATLDLAGFNQQLAGVVKAANADLIPGRIGNSSTTSDSTLTLTGSSTFSGAIQDTLGAGTRKVAVTVNGGTFILTASSTYTGDTTISAGTLQIGNATAGGTLSPTGVIINDGNLVFRRSNNIVQGTNFSASPITGTGNLYQAGAGGTTLTASNTYSGSTNVSAGLLTTNVGIKNGNAISITGGRLDVPANGGVSGVTSISTLTITGATSKLEIHDNDLVISSGSYASIVGLVKTGLTTLGGAGVTGISSAEVNVQTLPGTTLGVVDGADPTIAGSITTLSGYTIPSPATSILVKYTWAGDSNLDGQVDTVDFNRLIGGFGVATTWASGDFDYSSVVDSTDFNLLVSNFGKAALAGSLPGAAPGTAPGALVPEPAALSLLGAGLMLLKRKRR